MIFFGIDPGISATGFGIIYTEGNSIFFKDAGVILNKQKIPFTDKLFNIHEQLFSKITEHLPDYVCIEQAFYAKNVHTTLVLGHVRSAAVIAAKRANAKVVNYSPKEIKKAVTGNGNASKDQVKYMVNVLLRIPEDKHSKYLDMYDALAASICVSNDSLREQKVV